VAPIQREELPKLVAAEASSRLPFRNEEAEVRFLEAGDVRQGELLRREVIVLATPRAAVERIMAVAEKAGLRPVAIDAEPLALLRCYGRLLRRDEDRQRALALVNIGAASTKVVITRGSAAVFVKYLDVGGRQLDEAVAKNLRMPLAEAAALRRHNGDRRADQRDPEVARTIHESLRPVLDRLVNELSLCFRYASVTFRGQPLSQAILGGGEASQHLAEWLSGRLDLPVELGNPLRIYQGTPPGGRLAQWDVAAGLALRVPQN
jgi:type IV pilus assembly protein PilM